MSKYSIKFPDVLSSSKIINYQKHFSEIKKDSINEVNFNFSDVKFVFPAGLCPLATFIAKLKLEFPNKDYFLSLPKDSGVKNYLARIGFFNLLNINPVKINKNPCKETLFELTQIKNDSIENKNISFKRDSDIMDLIRNNLKCSETTIKRIGYAVGEIIQNIIDHSESSIGGFICAQVYKKNKTLEVCFSDYGVGIVKNIRNKFNYTVSDKRDSDCILEATNLSISTGSLNQNSGQGLFLTRKIIEDNKGFMKIYSNNGIIIINEDSLKHAECTFPIPGTTICLNFNLDNPIRDDIFDIKELDSQYYDNDIWDNILES